MDTHTKLDLVAAWFGATTTLFIFSVLFLIYLSSVQLFIPKAQNFKLYSALPGSQVEVDGGIEYTDARAKIIENFFEKYNSILAFYASTFIAASDKYHLDYRLLPAISMQESNGGKRVIKDSYNPFGFGIYGSKALKFNSWDEGIEVVSRSLREDYLNEGLTTPERIMEKYTPPSLSKGGTWAKGVTSFMEELR